MRMFRRIQFLLMLGGLAFLGFNFANPKTRQQTVKSVTAPLQVRKASPQAQAPAPEQIEVEERYVQIEGKLYRYNPQGSYNVNGVMTMYKNGNPKTRAQILAERQGVARAIQQQADAVYGQGRATVTTGQGSGQATRQVQHMMKNPVSAYTPAGAAAVLEGAREAAAAMDQRNRALNRLTNE